MKKSNSFFEAEWQSNTRIKQHSAAAAVHTISVLQIWAGNVKKLNQMLPAWLLKEDVLLALLTASNCAFLALKRIHSFRGITSV